LAICDDVLDVPGVFRAGAAARRTVETGAPHVGALCRWGAIVGRRAPVWSLGVQARSPVGRLGGVLVDDAVRARGAVLRRGLAGESQARPCGGDEGSCFGVGVPFGVDGVETPSELGEGDWTVADDVVENVEPVLVEAEVERDAYGTYDGNRARSRLSIASGEPGLSLHGDVSSPE
jgi:hypothetical protein